MIKAYDPGLRISNSGWAYLYCEMPPEREYGNVFARLTHEERLANIQFFRDFLDTVLAEKVPLDFFAWHYYGDDSAAAKYRVDSVNRLLKEYGLENLEHVNTEWSCVHLRRDSGGRWDYYQRDTMKSAVSVLATMLVFQNGGTSKAAYYDADSRSPFFGGLTDFNNQPRNHYHSLKAIKLLRRGEMECETTGETDTVRICASGNGKEHWVCITSEYTDAEISFKPTGIAPCKVRWYLLDEKHKLEVVRTGKFNGRAIPMKLKANSAVLLEFLSE